MSRWIMVRAELREAPSDWAPLIEVFREHGIEGTVQEDSPPSLAGYLAENQTDEARLNALCDDLVAAGAESIWREAIDEVDWAEAWKQFFKPMRLGRRLVTRPAPGDPPGMGDVRSGSRRHRDRPRSGAGLRHR